MNIKYQHMKQRSHGFTIVELLVSLLLGSALLVLSFNLYFSTKQSEMLATSILNTQTEQRNALHFIRQAIEHAGYTTQVTTQDQKKTLFASNAQFKAGQVIQIKGVENNQSLLVRSQGDALIPLRACNGDIIPPAIGLHNETSYEFYIEDEKLTCRLFKNTSQVGVPVVLASPVVALRLRAFTANTNLTLPKTQIRKNLDNIPADQMIKGVQVQLVVRSAERIRTDNKRTTIPVTGFTNLEFDDQFFYVNTSRFFLAQNQ